MLRIKTDRMKNVTDPAHHNVLENPFWAIPAEWNQILSSKCLRKRNKMELKDQVFLVCYKGYDFGVF